MDLKGKKVAVLGAGSSGLAAAALALSHGATVSAFDSGDTLRLSPAVERFAELGVVLTCGDDALFPSSDYDVSVISPGIDERWPIARAFSEASNELIGEVEFAFRLSEIPVVAITGTNGKTTSKELITSCLSSELETAYTKGNYNNHIGVPLTLLEINKKHEIGIIEMGANHKNEINFLCEIAKPNYGIITNIGKAHLEGFKNFEGVKSTKKELYDFIKKNNGIIFINNDDKTLNEISDNIKSITYGKNGDIIGEEVTSSVYTEVLFNKIKINSNLIGSYQFYNIMLAIAVAQHFSIKEKNIIKSLESYYPKNNRSQVVQSKSNLIILDAYNANPSSMNEMINSFYKIKKEGKVCILGDMGELGIFSKDEHEEIIKLNKKLNLKTFYIGSEFKKLTKKNSFIDFQEFKNYLKDFPITNSTILIKGSRSQKLENIVELL